jgi:natural product precursor
MKKNSLSNKLNLVKQTMSRLNQSDLNHLKGGGNTTSCGFATCNNELTCAGLSCDNPKICNTTTNCPTATCTGVKTC